MVIYFHIGESRSHLGLTRYLKPVLLVLSYIEVARILELRVQPLFQLLYALVGM